MILYDRQPIPLPYRAIIPDEQLLYLSRCPCHYRRRGMLPRQCHVCRDHVRIFEETASHQQCHDHEEQQRYPPPYDPGRHLPHHLQYLLAPQFYVLISLLQLIFNFQFSIPKFQLVLHQLIVSPPQGRELLMRPFLHDASLVQHHDLVGVTYRA